MKKQIHTTSCRQTGRLLFCLMLMLLGLPLTIMADPINITTQKAWDNFVKGYDGAETVLNLQCDITLEATGVLIDKFKGTLNGNGHSFIFKYEDDGGKDSAPFEDFEGTIKNLKLTGYIKFRYGFASYRESVPLIRDLESTVVIENCLCDVQFTECSSSGATYNRVHIGGFIGQMTSSSGNATFRNCAFTGGFSYTDSNHTWKDTGGFVGYQSGGKITFENCLSCFTLQDGWTVETIEYFVGNPEEDDITMTNSYGYCNLSVKNKSGVTVATNTMIRNGEVAYKLNGQESRTGKWAQTIDTDGMPYLTYFFPDSKTVYLMGTNTYEGTTDKWATLYYPIGKVNLPDDVTAYTVSGVKDDKVVLIEHKGNITALPVVLHSEDGIGKITLEGGYYNIPEFSGLLKGSLQVATATSSQYVLQTTGGEAKFVRGGGAMTAWSCYMSADTLTRDTYYIEKSEQESNYGKNLVQNGSFDDSDNNWTLQSGSGNKRKVDTDNLTPSIGNYLHTGKYGAIVYQDIDLSQYFRDTELDATPNVYLSFDYCCTNYLTSQEVICTFYDAYDNQLEENKYLSVFNKDEVSAPAPWQTMQSKITVPKSARKVRITVNGGGTGPSGDSSIDGPGYDNFSFIVQPSSYTWPTHKVTVTSDTDGNTKNATAHTLYGTGEYLEGTTVHIGTDHECVGHDCRYCFTGYKIGDKIEEDPQVVTSQRAITIGTGDITCDAIFNRAAFSKSSLGLPTGLIVPVASPEIINLPPGYTGKPVYSSSNTSIATVDENTGKVTYVGKTTEGCIIITADLPAQGTYHGDKISYFICFVSGGFKDIYSADDFKKYASDYKGKPVHARLCENITLDNGYYWDEFEGIFDGQGHTITVDYSTDNNNTQSYYAPFYEITNANAVFRNINIAGTIYLNKSYNHMDGLINTVDKGSNVLIENCNSSVLLKVFYKANSYENYLSGFVGEVDEECKQFVMKDCSFTGRYYVNSTCDLNFLAGFVANIESDNTSFINCYCDFSNNYDQTSVNRWYVLATPKSDGTIKDPICYTSNFYVLGRNTTGGTKTLFREISGKQVTSGEITYALNNGRTSDNAVWVQTIGTDSRSRLRAFDQSSLEVFHTNASDCTIGTSGWGTLYYPTATALPEGTKAYTIDKVDGDNLVLKEVEGSVPARTPAIICTLGEGESEADELTIPLVSNYYNKYAGTGMLKGVYERTAAPGGSYVLQNHDGDVAFYQVDTSVAQPYVPAWHCYLDMPSEQQSYAKMNLRFDDETTGISNILEPLLRDGNVYDLEGRRVQTLQKGHIYIKNGKKFIVR